MKQITVKDFIDVVKKSNASEIGLVTETVVKLNKRGNPLAEKVVTKKTVGTFQFGGSFNEQLSEALDSSLGVAPGTTGHVETKSLPWGKWVEGAENKVIEHIKFEDVHHFYLRYYNNVEGTEMSVEYFVDGEPATEEDKENIEYFSPSKNKKGTTYLTENLGEVENKTLRTNVVDFLNIAEVTIDGVAYGPIKG